MVGINAPPDYIQEVKIGHSDGTVTDTTKQDGIVSIVSLLISPPGSSVSLTRNAVLSGRYYRVLSWRLGS
jgi:hypothetical protein